MEKRILQVVPEIDLRVKMDAMVHDLSQALEESARPKGVRVPTSFRRRTRSAGNLASLTARPTHSDDSVAERLVTRSKEFSSLVQSDSDEVSATSQRRLVPYQLQKRTTHVHNQMANFESDSVNENFSPLRTSARRKRKMKRMDCEPLELPRPGVFSPPIISLAAPSAVQRAAVKPNLMLPGPSGIKTIVKKKKVPLMKDHHHHTDRLDVATGKRKRSVREKSAEVDMPRRLSKSCRVFCQGNGDHMELDRDLMSSSSLSSSESDAGLQTNDEGREGDDEQSDWPGENRVDEETDLEPDDPAFQNIFQAPLDHMTSDARQAYTERIERLKEDLDREIRGGRRRLNADRPGFSVLTSANEKLSRFLQDCQTIELRLHPMGLKEQEGLLHLVNLYSLRMRVEHSERGACPVLLKTHATPRSVQIDPGALAIHDFKKRRKQPAAVPNADMDVT